MSDSKLERLFWEEIDDKPSVARQEQIEALARHGPEARRELDELHALAAQLDAAEELPPPPELTLEVRRRLADRPAHDKAARGGLLGWMRQTQGGGWQPRLAYAAFGVLIGVFCTYLFIGGTPQISDADRSRLSGALNVGGHLTSDAYEIALGDAAGTLRFSSDGARLVATLLPAPNQTLDLVMRRDGNLELLWVEGIHASHHEVTTSSGAVRLVADGPVSMVVEVGKDGPQVLAVGVSMPPDTPVLDRQLDLTQLTGGD